MSKLKFPTHLRKMWSGSEVQAWIDEHLAEQANQEPVAWRECSFCGVEHQIKSDSYILDTKTDEVFCKKCYVHTHEQPVQEPKYWTYMVNGTWRNIDSAEPPDDAYDEGTLEPLYAAPVRTKDLTDEELWEAAKTAKSNDLTDAFRAVIAADREKNK